MNAPLHHVAGDRDGKGYINLELVFHSHDIKDASPPTCTISWDHQYRDPLGPDQEISLLPGCYIEDSREGSHMTYVLLVLYSGLDLLFLSVA